MRKRNGGNGATGLLDAPPGKKRGPGRPPKAPKAPRAPKDEITKVVVPPIEKHVMEVEIVGTSDLIVHAWSEKAKREMREKQSRGDEVAPKKKREAKNPFEDFKQAFYLMPGKRIPKNLPVLRHFTTDEEDGDSWPYVKDTFGIPSTSIKKAMVTCTKFLTGISGTLVQAAIHVVGYRLPIKYKRVYMREDTVRVGAWNNKVADLRYRPAFREWSCTFRLIYSAALIRQEQILNLLQNTGFYIGLFEWRPEKTGPYGMFEVRRG